MTERPPPLDYSTPGKPARPPGSWPLFSAGCIGGALFSGAYYAVLTQVDMGGGKLVVLFGALIAKVIVGIVLINSPRRSLGVGVIASIPLVGLVLGGLCFYAIQNI